MAYRLKRGRGVGAEVRRVFDRQLAGAIAALSSRPPDVAAARRHVKKARATLLLTRHSPGGRPVAADRRLRKVNHLLGALTDADMVVEALRRVRAFDPVRVPPSAADAVRNAFVQHARTLQAAPELDWVRGRALRLLHKQRDDFADLAFFRCGVRDAAAAVRRAHRNARAARANARGSPTQANFHAWRRRTKQEWYLLRLIDADVLGRLGDDLRRIEALDDLLGELHDADVLQHYLRKHSPLPRAGTAAVLRAARAYTSDLKRRVWRHVDAQDEPPRELEARVLSLWRSGEPLAGEPGEDATWARNA